MPALLKEVVEANGGTFVRAGFVGFGASSLDFELEFDTDGPDYQSFYDTRSTIGLAILARFNAEQLEFAYPTQTTFTAAPDGTMIGHISLPERCANLCFGGVKRNRLFMAASHSLYSVYVNTQGAVGG